MSVESPAGPPPPAPAMPSVSFKFCTAKVAGEGEDADPILRVGPDLGLLGVFDGMGGAGGRVYDTPDGRHSGAYIASRFARNVVERLMLELIKPEWNLDGPATAGELHRVLASSLAARLAELKAPETSLRSKLVKALPTTMTLAVLQRTDPAAGAYACHLFWAGDSRAYLLDPEGGARQLTTDDLRSGGDAMRNLTDDSVMSNCISADTEFHINHHQVELQVPFLLLCATDGCFAYLRSPMHFEHLLLSTMQAARDVPGWQQALEAEVTAITGDDAAIALLGLGADLGGFKQLFKDRTAEIQRRFIDPLEELDGQVRRAEQELAGLRARRAELGAELWVAYKPGYERYLAAEAPAGEEV
ncbi:MAG TPA: protein phosphatase 2C domain-containing protein, partial [Actinomycetes bacterium]|nr:protein phosphatase 2C domain-containing protein [Actinomycetes bacterium]